MFAGDFPSFAARLFLHDHKDGLVRTYSFRITAILLAGICFDRCTFELFAGTLRAQSRMFAIVRHAHRSR